MRNKKTETETVTLKKGDKEVQLNYSDVRKAVLVLRAVNHKLRRTLINLLKHDVELFVTDIYTMLDIEQSVASQHLNILKRAKVLNARRSGKKIYYSLNKVRLDRIEKIAEDITK